MAISSCTHQYSQSIKLYLCLSLVQAVNTSGKEKGKNALLRAYSFHCNHKSSLTFCVTKKWMAISPLWSHVKRFCLRVKRFLVSNQTGPNGLDLGRWMTGLVSIGGFVFDWQHGYTLFTTHFYINCLGSTLVALVTMTAAKKGSVVIQRRATLEWNGANTDFNPEDHCPCPQLF